MSRPVGYKHTEETKQKMTEVIHFQRPRTDDEKKRISESLRERYRHCGAQTSDIYHRCLDCGKLRWVRLEANGQPQSLRCRPCAARERVKRLGMPIGTLAHNWKGGKTTSRGYKAIKVYPDNFFYAMADGKGYILEHRLIVAKALGRNLHYWEIVHHKHAQYPAGSIEDKQDNRYPENLQLVTDDRHRQITRLEIKIKKQTDIIKELKEQLKNERTKRAN